MFVPHKEIGRLLLAVLFFALTTLSASAQGFFHDPDEPVRGIEVYESPRWDGLDWRPSFVAEAELDGRGASETILAVASNRWGSDDPLPKYVRAMALVIADRLRPDWREVKLADYQLKYRRFPDPVEAWDDREVCC